MKDERESILIGPFCPGCKGGASALRLIAGMIEYINQLESEAAGKKTERVSGADDLLQQAELIENYDLAMVDAVGHA